MVLENVRIQVSTFQLITVNVVRQNVKNAKSV